MLQKFLQVFFNFRKKLANILIINMYVYNVQDETNLKKLCRSIKMFDSVGEINDKLNS